SALEDGTTWSGLDVDQLSTSTDNINSILASHRELNLLGSQTSQIWVNAGDANNPLQPLPGSLMQLGILAPFTAVNLDNAPFLVGLNELGFAQVFRLNGTTPLRISTHAVEYDLSLATNLDQCIAYAFQERGHAFYHLYIPSARWSWRYDVATSVWHK